MEGLASTCQPSQETMMSAAIGNLSSQINQLQDKVQYMATKLEPVLDVSKVSPSGTGSDKVPTKPRLVMEIDAASEKIMLLRMAIDEINDKIVL